MLETPCISRLMNRFKTGGNKLKRTILTSITLVVIMVLIFAGFSNCSFYKKVDDDMQLEKVGKQRDEAWKMIEADKPDSAATIYVRMAGTYTGKERNKELLTHYGVAMVNLGYIWLYEWNNAEQAYVWLERGRVLGEKYDLPLVKLGAYDNLGKIYADYRCFDQAEKFYRDALREALDAGMEWEVTMCFTDLVNLALARGDISSVGEDIYRVGDFKFSDPDMLAFCQPITRGLRQWLEGKPEEGAASIAEADKKTDALVGSKRFAASQRMLLGEALIAAGLNKEGLTALSDARNVAQSDSLNDLLETSYRLLAKAYGSVSLRDSSAFYDYKALQIHDSLFNASKLGRIRDLEVAAVQDNLQRQVLQEQNNSRQMRQFVFIGVLFCLVVVIFAVWLAVNYRKVRLANRELYKRNLELANVLPGQKPLPAMSSEDCSDTHEVKECGQYDSVKGSNAGNRAASLIATADEVLSPDFTIDRLSEMTGIRSRILADELIEATGKNFKTLVTERRVREACRLFADDRTSRMYSIEGVAERVGYRSRTHFSRVFKEVTGMTASEFVKQARSSQST